MNVDGHAGTRGTVGMRKVTRRARHLAVWMALVSVTWTISAAAAVCYVNAAATGANTGTTWGAAYTDLQSALGDATCGEVWVAFGIYKPTAASDQNANFNIGPSVAVYGGFGGNETSRTARKPAMFVTTLSGAISGGNSQHVVVMNGTAAGAPITSSTVLDGFTVTGGNNGNGEGGGGLWCRGGGSGHVCSPTLANLVFVANQAASGGAIEFDGYDGGASTPTLTNVVFNSNTASLFGGAIFSNGQVNAGVSSPTLTNVSFNSNSGLYGGAMANDGTGGGHSAPTLNNVSFIGNNASTAGGAMFNNGGSGASSPTITNSTFYGNHSTGNGGAIYNSGATGGSNDVKLAHVTFNNNSAQSGGAIFNMASGGGTSYTTLLNSIVWGDTAAVNGAEFYSSYTNGAFAETSHYFSVVAGGCNVDCGGGPIYTTNPDLGPLANNGGFAQTMLPGAGGSAINAIPCSYSVPWTDQRGAARPDPISTGANRCDIGAVEANSLAGDVIFTTSFGVNPRDL